MANLKIVNSLGDGLATGAHDIVHRGRTLKFNVESIKNGVALQYVHETEMPKEMHETLNKLMPGVIPQKKSKVVYNFPVRLNWLERLFRISLEKKAAKKLVFIKKDVARQIAIYEERERIMMSLVQQKQHA